MTDQSVPSASPDREALASAIEKSGVLPVHASEQVNYQDALVVADAVITHLGRLAAPVGLSGFATQVRVAMDEAIDSWSGDEVALRTLLFRLEVALIKTTSIAPDRDTLAEFREAVQALHDEHSRSVRPAPYTSERALIERLGALLASSPPEATEPEATTREEVRLVAQNGQTTRTNEDTASKVAAGWSIDSSPVIAIERRTVTERVTPWARVPVGTQAGDPQ